jgi:pimeloyl-ACP methyl ester carboxylesterase
LAQGDVVTPKPGTPKDIFYSDISDSVAEPWISKLKTHSYRTFYSTMTIEPWLQIPSSYLICTLDAAIPLPVQEMMIEAAQKKNPKAFDLVERIEAGHSPFLSKPEATAAYLERAASVA